MSRIFGVAFSAVYPLYITKVERKGRTKDELDAVIRWVTGFDDEQLARHSRGTTTFREFFDEATLNPHADLVTGVICGIRVEQIEDPLMSASGCSTSSSTNWRRDGRSRRCSASRRLPPPPRAEVASRIRLAEVPEPAEGP